MHLNEMLLLVKGSDTKTRLRFFFITNWNVSLSKLNFRKLCFKTVGIRKKKLYKLDLIESEKHLV